MKSLATSRSVHILLSLLVPAWFTFSRVPFGVAGWMMLIVGPIALVLAIILLALVLAFCFRADVRQRRALLPADARPLWWLFISLFVAGFFLVDFGDTEDSVGSVFTVLAGRSLATVSGIIELVLLGVTVVALIWATVRLIGSYIKPTPATAVPAAHHTK